MIIGYSNLVSTDIDRKLLVVRFVHFSVQEFLRSHQPTIEAFGLESNLAYEELARRLISLLKILHSHRLEVLGQPGMRNLVSLLKKAVI